MKKLLFIILTLLFTTELFSSCEPPAGPKVVYNTSVNEPSHGNYIAYYFSKEEGRFLYFYKTSYSCAITYPMPTKYQKDKNKVLHDLSYIPDEIPYFFNEDNEFTFIPNPEPNSNSPRCSDTFVKDGQFYNCNPATNESEFVENSEGFEEKENGIYPKCKSGYSVHNIGRLTSSGTENQFYCLKNSNDEPSKWVGQTPIDTSNSSGSYYTPNGGKDYSWKDNQGNNYNYTPSTGVLITKDAITGSMSAHAVGSSFQPGDSFTPNGLGYAPNPDGSYGNGGTGGDGNNSGSGENPNPTNPDEPIDNKPASNSCNDSSLTLQEKMLCEMNAGIKKLNSESTPSNSLNQLMKDLNNKSTQNNDSLDTVKNNTNVTNQNLNITNTKLDNLNSSTNTTNTKLDNLNTSTNTTNTKLDNLNTSTNSTNSKLDSLNTSTNSKLNEINSSLKNIENGLNGNGDDNSEYGNKFGKIEDDTDETNSNFMTFYEHMKSSYSGLTEQLENTKDIFSTGLSFNPIQKQNNNDSLKSCLSVEIWGKTIYLDFISAFVHIKPMTTIIFQLIMLIGAFQLFFKSISSIKINFLK